MPALSETILFTTGTDSNGNPIKSASVTYPAGVSGAQTYYSDKIKGDGYYGGNGLHTAAYTPWPESTMIPPGENNNFRGSIVLQATLATDPSDSDWFIVAGTDATFDGSDQTNRFLNFVGNFVWIRAKLVITQGVLTSIQVNH